MTLTIEDVLDVVLEEAREESDADEALARVKKDVLTYWHYEEGNSEETLSGSEIYRDQIVQLWGSVSAVARVGFEVAQNEETFLTDATAKAAAALELVKAENDVLNTD